MFPKLAGPQRAAALVIDAIRTLFKSNGSTAKNITEYLTAAHSLTPIQARKTATTTLSRGMAFGAFTRNRSGLYQLTDFIGSRRGNRILKQKTANGIRKKRVAKTKMRRRKYWLIKLLFIRRILPMSTFFQCNILTLCRII